MVDMEATLITPPPPVGTQALRIDPWALSSLLADGSVIVTTPRGESVTLVLDLMMAGCVDDAREALLFRIEQAMDKPNYVLLQ